MISLTAKLSVSLCVISALFSSIPLVTAKPGGSTVCAISPALLTRMKNNGAMGPLSPNLTMSLVAGSSYTAGGAPMTIRLNSAVPVWGILLYAENGLGSHVGSFAVPNNNFRSLSLPDCKNELATSSLTHANGSPKGTGLTFQWTPPKTAQGPLNLQAIIVSDTTNGFRQLDTLKIAGTGTPQTFSSPSTATPTSKPSSSPKISAISITEVFLLSAAVLFSVLA